MMIEILSDFPDNVLALNAKGTVTRDDYRRAVVPELRQKRKKYTNIRVIYHIGYAPDDELQNAFWRNMVRAFNFCSDLEKMAVVTDHRQIRLGMKAVVGRYMSHSHKVYGEADWAKAKTWIKE